ncbi:hypothetical protein [Aquisediminimonas profunda]|uniref:hypothetical protein n=1 Tax=Aquisediminimonas profunda TaxID=1550733 RepID=UPI001C63B37C|nr:hypothetical protein [Aquisediminimonas profunda]
MKIRALCAGAMLTLACTTPAVANHAWTINGKQLHWARTANPVKPTVDYKLDNNLWGPYLSPALAGWNKSNIATDPDVVEFILGNPVSVDANSCPGTAGRVTVCNYAYGATGWLGVAVVEYDDVTGHIQFASVKMNDTYFNMSTYNKPAWRASVLCQEIGHTLGLSHQDTKNFNPDLKDIYGRQTCMDYTAKPDGNEWPNLHDYQQLASIYSHLDSITTTSTTSAVLNYPDRKPIYGNTPADWGKAIAFGEDGRGLAFAKKIAANRSQVTFVRWVP